MYVCSFCGGGGGDFFLRGEKKHVAARVGMGESERILLRERREYEQNILYEILKN